MKNITILYITFILLLIGCERASPQEKLTSAAESRSENISNDIANPLGIPLHSEINNTETVCILLRHAEKENYGTDPNLTQAGLLRAEELKRILSSVDIDNIYTTPFNRTRQTASPLALNKGIAITEYSPYESASVFINKILSQNKGRVVVIVGHSNTIPEMLKVLSNNTVNITISDTQFDNIYITKNSELQGSVFVNQKKYGQITP